MREGQEDQAPEKWSPTGNEIIDGLRQLRERFVEAMEDDFNTARAIGYLFDTVRQVNNYLDLTKKGSPSPEKVAVIRTAKDIMSEIGGVLGLFQEDPDVYFQQDREREAAKRGLDMNEIARLIEARNEARSRKEWSMADQLRADLASKGVVLKDGPEGTTWMIE